MRPRMKPKYHPEIMTDGLAGADRRQASYLNRLVWNLWAYEHRFAAAHKLCAYHFDGSCRTLPLSSASHSSPREWRRELRETSDAYNLHSEICGIALRDAVMSVYHAQRVLAAIHKAVGGLEGKLASRIDEAALRESGRILSRAFPDATALRNALGHSGENASKADAMSKLEIANFLATPFLNGTALGSKLSVRYAGKLLGFELSVERAEAFDTSLEQVAIAFKPAMKWARRRAAGVRGADAARTDTQSAHA